MASPYLNKPLRTLEQAYADMAKRRCLPGRYALEPRNAAGAAAVDSKGDVPAARYAAETVHHPAKAA